MHSISIISIILLNIVITFRAQEISFESNQRILYGSPADIKQAPYYAHLWNCGAAIISERWVVTATHCVNSDEKLQDKKIWAGGVTLNDSTLVYYDTVFLHPNYTTKSKASFNDIAVLRVIEPLKFNEHIKPVQLPIESFSQNLNVVFHGRGKDETGHVTKVLMKVQLLKMSPQKCIEYSDTNKEEKYLKKQKIVCTKRQKKLPSICYGDSGSPLVYNNTLIGIASYIDRRSCKKNRIAFFTGVASYVEWIQSVTGDNFK